MESTLIAALEQLTGKIDILAAQRDEARRHLEEAKGEAADLKRRVAELEEELHKRDLDIEYLTVSRRLADTPQGLAEARATIRRMIKRVDKAIALVKGDASV